MSNTWSDKFCEAFDSMQEKLSLICNYASGCREGWIQGELFYTLNNGIAAAEDNWIEVNTGFQNNLRKKFDLFTPEYNIVAELPQMAAEIKVISEDCNIAKCIVGENGNIAPYYDKSERGKFIIDNKDKENTDGTWSLINDYFNLIEIVQNDYEKYLILVIPNIFDKNIPKNLRLLNNINFKTEKPPIKDKTSKDVTIRMWQL